MTLFLAFKEMRRALPRFALLVAAVALLVFLILFQQSLQNGLLTSFVGAIRSQTAPVLVYSTDGQRTLQASTVTPEMEQAIADVAEVGATARLAQGTFTVRTGSDVAEAAIIGYESAMLGGPAEIVEGRLPEQDGEAVASDADAGEGFGIGEVVRIEPGGLELQIVGLAGDAQLNAGPALFTSYQTYLDAVRSQNPDAGEPLPNAIGVEPAEGVDPTEAVSATNAVSIDLEALTRADAAEKAPGVAQVRQSFRIIFLLYGLVVPLVTGLFFLILTLQKAGALTLLRALGSPARRLVLALLVQAVVVIALGLAVGIALYAPVSAQRIGTIPLSFETTAVITWSALLLVLGLASVIVAARRVMAIDPIEATTGDGGR